MCSIIEFDPWSGFQKKLEELQYQLKSAKWYQFDLKKQIQKDVINLKPKTFHISETDKMTWFYEFIRGYKYVKLCVSEIESIYEII